MKKTRLSVKKISKMTAAVKRSIKRLEKIYKATRYSVFLSGQCNGRTVDQNNNVKWSIICVRRQSTILISSKLLTLNHNIYLTWCNEIKAFRNACHRTVVAIGNAG